MKRRKYLLGLCLCTIFILALFHPQKQGFLYTQKDTHSRARLKKNKTASHPKNTIFSYNACMNETQSKYTADIRSLFLLKDLCNIPYNLKPLSRGRAEKIFKTTNVYIAPWKVRYKLPSVHTQIIEDTKRFPIPSEGECPNCFLSASCYLKNVSLMYPALGGHRRCQFSDDILEQFSNRTHLPFNLLFVGDSRMRQVFQGFVHFFVARESVKSGIGNMSLMKGRRFVLFWRSNTLNINLFYIEVRLYDISQVVLERFIKKFLSTSVPLYVIYGTAVHFEVKKLHKFSYFEERFINITNNFIHLKQKGLITELIHLNEPYPAWGTFLWYENITSFVGHWLQKQQRHIILYDAFLLMADLYREICYREHPESKVSFDPIILSKSRGYLRAHWAHLSRDWHCSNRNHPGRVVFKAVVRQVLAHIFYNHPWRGKKRERSYRKSPLIH